MIPTGEVGSKTLLDDRGHCAVPPEQESSALKLVRYSRAVRRLRKALSIIKEELVLLLSTMLLLLFFAATGIYYFEHEAQPEAFSSVFHSLWWAVTTLTTVGYGDVYPVTIGGRLFTFFVLVIGLGVVAAPCGLLASALSEARRLENSIDDAESPRGDSSQPHDCRGLRHRR